MHSLTIELQEEQTQAIAGLPYLSLQLSQNLSVAIQLKFVRETLMLDSERFTQMPNVHSCLVGLIEHRSSVFWVLDLPQLLGLPPLDFTAMEAHIAVLKIGEAFLGLGVYRIGRVLRFSEPEIVSPLDLHPTQIPNEMIPFLRGWIAQPQGMNNNLYLLDAEAIASADLSI